MTRRPPTGKAASRARRTPAPVPRGPIPPSAIAAVGVISLVVLIAGAFLVFRSGGSPVSSPSPTGSPGGRPIGPPSSTPLANPPAEPASSGLQATISTSQGDIVLRLYDLSAPVATENFVNLAEAGYYDGVVFHRIVPGFVIQGGDGVYAKEGSIDVNRVGTGGPGYTIVDEAVVGPYRRGTLAMARTPAPNSQGSQFFVVLDDAASRSLDAARTYVIFGEVLEGMDVVDRIAAGPNSGSATGNRALEPVAMRTVAIQRPAGGG